MGITQRQVEGQPEPFDLLNVDARVSDERKYFGEVSIHFASGSPPLLLPITQAERLNLYAALQGEASFIQIESLDNRIVSVRRKAIADVFFSEEAYDDYGPEEDYGSQHLGIFPDEKFWQIIEQLEEPEFLDGEFDKNEINEAMKKLLFDDSELDELIANGSIKPEECSAVKKQRKKPQNCISQGHEILRGKFPACVVVVFRFMKAEIYMKPFMICNGVANKRWCAWRLKNIIMKFF